MERSSVVIFYQGHNLIIFIDGRIVHTNVDPPREATAILEEIAANAGVLKAAADIKDPELRAKFDRTAIAAIQAKAAQLGPRT